jgi:large subunit ribosomal protein L11
MKEIKRIVKLHLYAGSADPAMVGKDLAPTGVNLLQFCKEYNELTRQNTGLMIPAEVTVFEDRSYKIRLKTPPTSFLLKKYAKIEKGAAKPGHTMVGSISQEDLKKIAEIKLADMNTTKLESVIRMIEGTAKNMGITIQD